VPTSNPLWTNTLDEHAPLRGHRGSNPTHTHAHANTHKHTCHTQTHTRTRPHVHVRGRTRAESGARGYDPSAEKQKQNKTQPSYELAFTHLNIGCQIVVTPHAVSCCTIAGAVATHVIPRRDRARVPPSCANVSAKVKWHRKVKNNKYHVSFRPRYKKCADANTRVIMHAQPPPPTPPPSRSQRTHTMGDCLGVLVAAWPRFGHALATRASGLHRYSPQRTPQTNKHPKASEALFNSQKSERLERQSEC
jgi:hypothetical protein